MGSFVFKLESTVRKDDSLYGLFGLHDLEGLVGFRKAKSMGYEFFEVVDTALGKSQRHMGMTDIAYPNTLKPKVFPPDIMETINLDLTVGFAEPGCDAGPTDPCERDTLAQGLGSSSHLKGNVNTQPMGALQISSLCSVPPVTNTCEAPRALAKATA
jgi:hypothetical protein